MTKVGAQPRAHHPGLVLFALAMGGFAIGTTEFATMSLLPPLAKGLSIDEPTAGNIISAYALGVVVGAPVLAILSAKMRRGTLLIGLMALFALANGASALAPTYHWMLLFRFLSGLPHGAYFGIAALVASSLLGPARRTEAVGRVIMGLTVATIFGVPAADGIGQILGWRWGFGIVAILSVITMILVALFAPNDAPRSGASPLSELSVLKNRQIWLTLGIGAIGFGGLFSVYTYLASTLVAVTGMTPGATPIVFACFGIGMTIGNALVPRFADRALMATAGVLLMIVAAALALYPLCAGNVWAISADIFVIGIGGALSAVLQTRLMDVAGEAQSLAAALNHSAFNIANAIGPVLAGLAISAGYGWTSTGLVGCALTLGGAVVWAIAWWDARRTEPAHASETVHT